MFKPGDKVILTVDYPDDNEELYKGDTGIVVGETHSKYLICFDKVTDEANGNNHWIDPDYIPPIGFHIEIPSDWNCINRLWWVGKDEIKLFNTIAIFRKKKRGERIQEYRIAKKIFELDFAWKERQNAKASNLPV